MREYLTVPDISNTVSMLSTSFDGTILVVEGPTDHRLYGKFTSRDDVRTVIAHSKENVTGVVKETTGRRRMRNVLGIVDSDLDRLLKIERDPPVFMTDTRDSESLITSSDSFREVLWEYADQEKLASYERKYGNVIERIEDAAYPIGLLMFVSYQENLNLSFKELIFTDFIEKSSLRCDTLALCRAVIRNTIHPSISASDLYDLLQEYLGDKHYTDEVCRGHDLVSIMNLGLKYTFGSDNAQHLKDAAIGSALRISYDSRDFGQTDLYIDSRKWAESSSLKLWNF